MQCFHPPHLSNLPSQRQTSVTSTPLSPKFAGRSARGGICIARRLKIMAEQCGVSIRAERFRIYGNKTDAQTEEQKSLGSLFPPFSDTSKCLDCSPVGPTFSLGCRGLPFISDAAPLNLPHCDLSITLINSCLKIGDDITLSSFCSCDNLKALFLFSFPGDTSAEGDVVSIEALRLHCWGWGGGVGGKGGVTTD